MSSRENEKFLEEKETRRLERGSSEGSSESAHGQEPSEGGDDVAQTEYLVSPGENPPENDHPQGAVEENPNYQMLENETSTPTRRPVEDNPNYQMFEDETSTPTRRPVEDNPTDQMLEDKTNTPTKRTLNQPEGPPASEAGGKSTWKERENLYKRIWQHVTDLGQSPQEGNLMNLVDILREEDWRNRGNWEDGDVDDFMQEWARRVAGWKLSPRAVETLIQAIGKGRDSKNNHVVLLREMALKVKQAYNTNQASNKTKPSEEQETTTKSEIERIGKLNEELRTVNDLPNMTVLEETWGKVRKLVPGKILRDQSTDPTEIRRIRESLTDAIEKMTPAALTILESMAKQKPPESVASNKKLLGLQEEIGKRAGAAHQSLRGAISKRGMEADKTGAINKVIEFICTLAVGDVIMKTTAEASVHPSPTARITALMAERTGMKTWSEITKSKEMAATDNRHSPDANTMLRKASMCLLYKLEGTKSPKWRATVQLMNWVGNNIPILAIPLLLDIFPHLDLKNRDRKGYASLLNTATAKQWNDKATGNQEMVKILRCSRDEWESGKNISEEKLRLLTQHPLAENIRQFNALALLWAVTALGHENTMTTGLKNREGDAKRAAKEALKNSVIPGAFRFLNTSEVEYNEPRMEAAIQKCRDKGKDRLAKELQEAHNATKRGDGKGIAEVFGDKGSKCPDCEKTGEVKILILNPSDPAQGVHEHLGHCGESAGKRKHRHESPQTHMGNEKRNRPEDTEAERPMTAMAARGRGTRGRNNRGLPFGRGGFHGNSPIDSHPSNRGRFQDNASGMEATRNQGGFHGNPTGYNRNQGESQHMGQNQPHQGYYTHTNNAGRGMVFRNQNNQRADQWNNQDMPNQQDM